MAQFVLWVHSSVRGQYGNSLVDRWSLKVHHREKVREAPLVFVFKCVWLLVPEVNSCLNIIFAGSGVEQWSNGEYLNINAMHP